MQIERTALDGVLILTPRRHGDARGFFAETYNREALAAAGLDLPPMREEASWHLPSANTPLTFHDQARAGSRGQLLRCGRGAVVVTVTEAVVATGGGPRIDVTLSAADGRQVWVPAGWRVGWRALQDDSEIVSNATELADLAVAGPAPRPPGAGNRTFSADGAS